MPVKHDQHYNGHILDSLYYHGWSQCCYSLLHTSDVSDVSRHELAHAHHPG